LEATPDIHIVLMDIMMPVMDGYATIRAIRAIERFTSLPIIAVTGKAMGGERQRCLDAGANDYVPKPVDTAELLTALRPWLPATQPDADETPDPGERTPTFEPRWSEKVGVINGLKVLVVDDDFRSIFALTALLEREQSEVLAAESGAEALGILQSATDIDIVLMDIMMPVMDGYETIRAIRGMGLDSLPIVAITAKAMAGERQRCLEAGASDYVPKPIDTTELIAALRPWLPTSAVSSA